MCVSAQNTHIYGFSFKLLSTFGRHKKVLHINVSHKNGPKYQVLVFHNLNQVLLSIVSVFHNNFSAIFDNKQMIIYNNATTCCVVHDNI